MNRIEFDDSESNDQKLPPVMITECDDSRIRVEVNGDSIKLYPRQWLRVFSAIKWIKTGEISA